MAKRVKGPGKNKRSIHGKVGQKTKPIMNTLIQLGDLVTKNFYQEKKTNKVKKSKQKRNQKEMRGLGQ